MSQTDADLLRAHVVGDRRAFETLYRRHRARLHSLARQRIHSPEDADDAVQDAMLAAHRAAGSFRHDCAVASWLHRIVVNACMDTLRRRSCPTTELTEESAVVPDHGTRCETSLVVRQALMRLSADQRAAVVAVDMLGYSVADAARLLDVAEGTVKSRCARGRTRLAPLLDPVRPGSR